MSLNNVWDKNNPFQKPESQTPGGLGGRIPSCKLACCVRVKFFLKKKRKKREKRDKKGKNPFFSQFINCKVPWYTATFTNSIQVHDLQEDEELSSLEGGTKEASCLLFSPSVQPPWTCSCVETGSSRSSWMWEEWERNGL